MQPGQALSKDFFTREKMLCQTIIERDNMIEALLAQCQQLQQQIKALKAQKSAPDLAVER